MSGTDSSGEPRKRPPSDRRRVAALAVLLAGLALLAVWWLPRRGSGGERVGEVCAAARAGDWARALELSEELWGGGPGSVAEVDLGGGDELLDSAACRCAALMEQRRRGECSGLLEALLARPEADGWLPGPLLTAVAAEARRDRGEIAAAARLAARGAERYPQSFVMHFLEVDLRSRLEDEGAVIDEIAGRLPETGAARDRLALRLAERRLQREEWSLAQRLLGRSPPAGELGDLWYRLQGIALAGLGEGEALRRHYAAWVEAGAAPAAAAAQHALVVSMFAVADPSQTAVELLRGAIAADGGVDPDTERLLHRRLIGHLLVEERFEDAEAAYDAAVARLGSVPGLPREDLSRASAQALLARSPAVAGEGTVRFSVAGLEPGDQLLVSPAPELAADTPFEPLVLAADGRAEVRRRPSPIPLRWVLVSGGGSVHGSGTAWPRDGGAVEVAIDRGEAAPSSRTAGWAADHRPPADGRRRVLVVLLDCGDWRLIRFLQARGELPNLSAMIAGGRRAVLDSDPPYTAVALSALARPASRGVTSFVGLLHHLGGEVEALNFVGVNPVDGLSWLVPGEEGLFEAVGAGELSAANLLRSFGPVRAGRQAEVTGPYGQTRKLSGYRGSRPLSGGELAAFPGLEAPGVGRGLVEEMAADFDNAVRAAEGGQGGAAPADLTLLRVASLDILTHALFPALVRPGQGNGEEALLEVYRYVDSRLGEVAAAIDGDDVLIVMSDHGIRTAFEHDPEAFFVALGRDVPPGRVSGRPDLRGTGRLLTDLLGVETAWPDSGLGDWVVPLREAGSGG